MLEGSLINRLSENKNYTNRELKKGDDITLYYYSDRACYYIDEVISDKMLKVRKYYVCADKTKEGGEGHQDWVYFKSKKDYMEYLNIDDDREFSEEDDYEVWVYRYNKWQAKLEYKDFNTVLQKIEKDLKIKKDLTKDELLGLVICYTRLPLKDVLKLYEGKTVYRYADLGGPISFGVRDYYFDWEF